MAKPYCPFCTSAKPLAKSGWQLHVAGRPSKQRYECRRCHRMTVKPKWRKPRPKKAKKEKS